jgi:hypothetical protein
MRRAQIIVTSRGEGPSAPFARLAQRLYVGDIAELSIRSRHAVVAIGRCRGYRPVFGHRERIGPRHRLRNTVPRIVRRHNRCRAGVRLTGFRGSPWGLAGFRPNGAEDNSPARQGWVHNPTTTKPQRGDTQSIPDIPLVSIEGMLLQECPQMTWTLRLAMDWDME